MYYIKGREPIGLAEERRLTALHALNQIGAPMDAQLQTLTEQAAAIFYAPIAAIALVARNHQHIRNSVGVDLVQTIRSCSFSTHAIQHSGVYEIVDMDRHDIFAANPMVLGNPKIRYYCGAPLQLGNGRRVGMLVVADTQVRATAASAERDLLVELADAVVARMERLARQDVSHTGRTMSVSRGPEACGDARFASLCATLIAA